MFLEFKSKEKIFNGLKIVVNNITVIVNILSLTPDGKRLLEFWK